MKNLIEKSKRKVAQVKTMPYRGLYNEIDWNERLILLLGHRGAGKTTLILQRLKDDDVNGIYLSLDDFYFETNRLVEVIGEFYHKGFRQFYLDEVHRYQKWSKDIKQVYDDYDAIKLIATGSSILDISKGNADLSRRAVTYQIQGLSFREYLLIEKNLHLSPVSLQDILQYRYDIESDLLDHFSWENDFKNYLKYGYYPFFKDGKQSYLSKLEQTAHLVVDSDIIPFEGLNYKSIHSLKKLLFVISQAVPFTPNISKLSDRLDLPRNTLLKLLDILDQAKLIKLLKSGTKGVSYLQKPEKIYLENTNLIHLFAQDQPNVGNIRETFFFNQVSNHYTVSSSKFSDFMVNNELTFEIGGPTKGLKQIQGIPMSYLALDLKLGNQKVIPLWLFGFLY
ncbi:MAG: AAA family ATPase [Bacteroidetes bacterium]|jgi:predicted AAA+ superfamily ATPase|nr:AAA family ATPase [Bacteroidota bacterium]